MSESEIRDEFYLSDVVSNYTDTTNKQTLTLYHNKRPVTGSPTSINYDKEQSHKRRRRWRTPKEEERTRCLSSIAKDVVNIGVHVVHDDILLSKDELNVLSLGTNFVPPSRKTKRFILSIAMEKFVRRIRLKKHFATFDMENENTVTPESILHTRVNKTLSLEEAKQQFTPVIFKKSPIEHYIANILNNVQLEGDRATKRHFERKKWTYFYEIITRLKTARILL